MSACSSSDGKKPMEQSNEDLSKGMRQLSVTTDNSRENPPTLSDMPVDVVGSIIDKLDYRHQLKLRRVSTSFRALVDEQKPACGTIDVVFEEEGVLIKYDCLSVLYKNQKSSDFWYDEYTNIVTRDDFLKAALDDLASSLKNSKLHLEVLSVRSIYSQTKDGEKHGNDIRNVLESLNHPVSVKRIFIQGLSPSCLLCVIPYLKPGMLENITFDRSFDLDGNDLNSDSTEIDQLALFDQWKQAEKLELWNSFDRFPVEHATHFKRFYIDENDMDGEKFVRIKDFLSELQNLEQCHLRHWKFSRPDGIHEFLGEPVSSSEMEEIFHHPIPDSEYHLVFTCPINSDVFIEKKKLENK